MTKKVGDVWLWKHRTDTVSVELYFCRFLRRSCGSSYRPPLRLKQAAAAGRVKKLGQRVLCFVVASILQWLSFKMVFSNVARLVSKVFQAKTPFFIRAEGFIFMEENRPFHAISIHFHSFPFISIHFHRFCPLQSSNSGYNFYLPWAWSRTLLASEKPAKLGPSQTKIASSVWNSARASKLWLQFFA